MNTMDTTSRVTELQAILDRLNAPHRNLEELVAEGVHEGLQFVQHHVRIGPNYCLVRLVQDRDGTVTPNIDCRIPVWRLREDFNNLRIEIALQLFEVCYPDVIEG